MNFKKETKEKICTFYTSDYHFEMISLPYIEKNIEENKKIFILTENNLENTINKLISNINLNEEKKKKILDINWRNDNSNKKIEEISKKINKENDIVIFIKGREKYIEEINNIFENFLNNSSEINNTKIIDCYDLEEISEKMDKVLDKYSKILDIKGEKNFF